MFDEVLLLETVRWREDVELVLGTMPGFSAEDLRCARGWCRLEVLEEEIWEEARGDGISPTSASPVGRPSLLRPGDEMTFLSRREKMSGNDENGKETERRGSTLCAVVSVSLHYFSLGRIAPTTDALIDTVLSSTDDIIIVE